MNIDTIDKECLIASDDRTSVIFNELDEFETYIENGEERGAIDDTLTPKEGMLFATHEEAYDFYNRYALQMGFGVRKSATTSSKTDKTKIIGRRFVCSKEGKRKRDDKKTTDLHGCHSREIRVGCNALMWIRLTESGSWYISKFISQHNNHDLSTPSKAAKHRSHRKIHRQKVVKILITQLHNEGIPNASIARVVNTFEPDIEHTITSQQVHQHLRVERKNNLGRNCSIVVDHFVNTKTKDPGFFFNVEVSEDCTFRSVFWADRRSQESYKRFSDVIVFDITYRTNNYSLPFAPFTGVNHHFQSSLFGCALLADETEETFVWLFEQWLKCMDGKEPAVIITDQDAAMGNAIAKVFPNTLHRYCEWHLEKNIKENLVHLKVTHGSDIELDFEKLRSSDMVDEAEKCWIELITKYNLREKSWLPKLWVRRTSWMPCYLKDTFTASMRTSQRSESINAFFDLYVTSSTPLHEFVAQYDKAVASRRKAEEDADFTTMNSKPVLVLEWPLEEEAGKCYTSAVFDLLHTEMKDSVHYWAEKLHKNVSITTFKVGRPQVERSKWKLVTYDSNGFFVACQCKLFETKGFLCKHAVFILWKKQIPSIPEGYILKRWTIESRYQSEDVGFRNDVVGSEVNRELLWSLRYKMNKLLDEAYKSQSFVERMDRIATRELEEANNTTIRELQVRDSQDDHTISQCQSNTIPEFIIRDPIAPARTKGRPRQASRIQSSLEISQEDETKKRTCGFCKEKGHYRMGCLKAKEFERTLSK